MIGIYEIRNLVNGKVYIGQSVDIEKRLKGHREHETNEHLKNAFKKYGLENFSFSIIKECSIEDLNLYELWYILANCSFDPRYGYNIKLGNQRFGILPEETKKKMSESAKLSWKKGRDISNYHGGFTEKNYEEKRKKCALASKGRTLMYKGNKLIQAKPEEIEKYLAEGYVKGNIPFSEETRKRQSIAAKKRCLKYKPETTTGRKIMNKDGIDRYFSKEEINIMTKEGWRLGRTPGKSNKKEETICIK